MKKIAHLILGRFFIVALSIILQVVWMSLVLWQFSYQFTYANLGIRILAIILVLVIVNRWINPANKLSWTFLILLSPVFGMLVYFIFGRSGLTKRTAQRMDAINREVAAVRKQEEAVMQELQFEEPRDLHESFPSIFSLSVPLSDMHAHITAASSPWVKNPAVSQTPAPARPPQPVPPSKCR